MVCGDSYRFLFILLAVLLFVDTSPVKAAERITASETSEEWGIRNSSTSRGKVLWVDETATVFLYNGISTTPVQAKGSLGNVETSVFALGSGASAGKVIGAWRRGTDFAYVTIDGGTPVQVTATNPIDVNQPMN